MEQPHPDKPDGVSAETTQPDFSYWKVRELMDRIQSESPYDPESIAFVSSLYREEMCQYTNSLGHAISLCMPRIGTKINGVFRLHVVYEYDSRLKQVDRAGGTQTILMRHFDIMGFSMLNEWYFAKVRTLTDPSRNIPYRADILPPHRGEEHTMFERWENGLLLPGQDVS